MEAESSAVHRTALLPSAPALQHRAQQLVYINCLKLPVASKSD